MLYVALISDYNQVAADMRQVIARCEDPPLSILDNRAATYTKLEEFPKALADARHMIQLSKAEVKVR